MTLTEARAKFAALSHLSDRDFADLLAGSADDQAALLQIYADSLAITPKSDWQIFLADLDVASHVAQDLAPIGGLVAMIIAL